MFLVSAPRSTVPWSTLRPSGNFLRTSSPTPINSNPHWTCAILKAPTRWPPRNSRSAWSPTRWIRWSRTLICILSRFRDRTGCSKWAGTRFIKLEKRFSLFSYLSSNREVILLVQHEFSFEKCLKVVCPLTDFLRVKKTFNNAKISDSNESSSWQPSDHRHIWEWFISLPIQQLWSALLAG